MAISVAGIRSGYSMFRTGEYRISSVVRERARTTVRWATRRLKEAYSFSDPDGVITVWLSKDRASYHRQSMRIFGVPPISPYGFFSRRLGVVLLTASLGSGTVVHELVHALTAASFPTIPTWFDEGLGSRFLCYYLQQRGKLRTDYRRFRRDRSLDPTGLRSLKQVLMIRDMAAFQRRWERWILALKDAGGFDADLKGKGPVSRPTQSGRRRNR